MAKSKKNSPEFSEASSIDEKETNYAAPSTKGKNRVKKMNGSCFVLMPFSEPFNTYYKSIIKPAVNNAKLDSLRGDSLFRSSPIMADIWHMIQEAKVLVAELTGKNPNVFYELGLAHAIGKPVVLLSETIEDVPFDLQSLRVIIYDKNDPSWGNKLKLRLTKSIKETLSTPVDSVPQMFRKTVKSQAPVDPGLVSRVSALERRIFLWEREGVVFQNDFLDVSSIAKQNVLDAFLNIKNSRDAEYAVQIAMNYGFSSKMIERYLKEYTSASISREVLKKYGLNN